MKTRAIYATVVSTARVDTSVNGNPRYDVILSDGGTYRTGVDSGLAYSITNPEFKTEPHTFMLENQLGKWVIVSAYPGDARPKPSRTATQEFYDAVNDERL